MTDFNYMDVNVLILLKISNAQRNIVICIMLKRLDAQVWTLTPPSFPIKYDV